MPLTSTADVATDAPGRYARQLVSHLGRKLVTQSPEADDLTGTTRHRVLFDGGECELVERDGVLSLQAHAVDEATLDRVRHVVGSHLERFGQRTGLSVQWRD